MSSPRKPCSHFWQKAAHKAALCVDDLIYLANTRLSFRHVTTQTQLRENLILKDSFLGDAIPLYGAFTHLKKTGMENQEVLALFEKHIKEFIKDSILIEDTKLLLYKPDSIQPEEEKEIAAIEEGAKEIQERLKKNDYPYIYFMLLEMPKGCKIKDQSSGYPLGKHGSQRINKDDIKSVLALSKSERALLVDCKGSNNFIHTMTDIFYAKFCHYVKNERKNFLAAGKSLELPRQIPMILPWRF